MPELPEVETIRRSLKEKIVGKKIIDVVVLRGKVIKEPGVKAFKEGICGERVKDVLRCAKLLIIKLKENKYLIIHLRISGWLLYGPLNEKARISFKISNGKYLNYMDQRLLGELRLRKDYKDLKFVKNLGPEPFKMNSEKFKDIIKGKRTKIKVLLLDQTKISGIGNIYAQEALYLAKIDPAREAKSLNTKEAKRLFEKIVFILKEGIKFGGSSVDSYRVLDGSTGGMEKKLKVYARKNKPCFRCKTSIKKISLGGRGTCFCPKCQK